MTNTLGHWVVPNHIGVIKEDLRPCEVFDFMGDVGVSRKQTRPKPRVEIGHVEGHNLQGLYMDAYQDYGSIKWKIVKPAGKWRASMNKFKEFKSSANTNQHTLPDGIFVFGRTSQGRTRAKASSSTSQGTTSSQGPAENLA